MNFNLSIKEISTVSMVLFAVIDIVGSIPIIIDIKRRAGKIESAKASIVACLIMILFLFLGESILALIGIDVNSFAAAGALVIFFIALEMILGIKIYKEETLVTASIVPIAFPLVAGAGTMTSLLSLRAEYQIQNIIMGIVVNVLIVYLVLKNTHYLERLLGDGGIAILKKVFGVILMAIAVKLFTKNIGLLIPH
jgi:multiple antibiotic resistance protein